MTNICPITERSEVAKILLIFFSYLILQDGGVLEEQVNDN